MIFIENYGNKLVAEEFKSKTCKLQNEYFFRFLDNYKARFKARFNGKVFSHEIVLNNSAKWCDVYKDAALIAEKYGDVRTAAVLRDKGLEYPER